MKKYLFLLGLPLIAAFSSAGQISLTSGLIAYYPFNGNANDESGFGNHGIVSGATLTANEFGFPNSAYMFNGVSSYIRIPDNPILSPIKKFSICVKVNMKGFYNGRCYNNVILAKGDDRTSGSYSIRTTTNGLDCLHQDTTKHVYRCDVQSINVTTPDINNPPYIKLNNWDCLIGTYENDTVKMYVNGIFRYQYYEPSKSTNTADMYFGYYAGGGGAFWFNGIIDEVRIYNRVLNSDEINKYCSFDPLAIDEEANLQESKVSLYPNPATDKLQVDASFTRGDQVVATITDITGYTLYRHSFIATEGLNTLSVNVTDWANGIYLIHLKSDNLSINQRFFKK